MELPTDVDRILFPVQFVLGIRLLPHGRVSHLVARPFLPITLHRRPRQPDVHPLLIQPHAIIRLAHQPHPPIPVVALHQHGGLRGLPAPQLRAKRQRQLCTRAIAPRDPRLGTRHPLVPIPAGDGTPPVKLVRAGIATLRPRVRRDEERLVVVPGVGREEEPGVRAVL